MDKWVNIYREEEGNGNERKIAKCYQEDGHTKIHS